MKLICYNRASDLKRGIWGYGEIECVTNLQIVEVSISLPPSLSFQSKYTIARRKYNTSKFSPACVEQFKKQVYTIFGESKSNLTTFVKTYFHNRKTRLPWRVFLMGV
jgi:hypothetical protein